MKYIDNFMQNDYFQNLITFMQIKVEIMIYLFLRIENS